MPGLPAQHLSGAISAYVARDATERLGWRYAKPWAASTTSASAAAWPLIAAPLLVASRTSNPLVVSAAFGVSWLPWLLFALPGGVLVDRVDRRRLMIVIDWSRVAAMTVLATAIATGHASIALLYVVLFLVRQRRDRLPLGQPGHDPGGGAASPAGAGERLAVRRRHADAGDDRRPAGRILVRSRRRASRFSSMPGTYAASAIRDRAGRGGRYRSAPGSEPGSEPGNAPDKAGRPRRAGSVRAEVAEGFRWLAGQRVLRTMAVLIGLLNLTLTAPKAVLVLLARDRLHLGSVGYGLLFTAMAAGGIVGSLIGDRLIRWVTATWTIRVGLLIEAGMHLALGASRSAYLIGFALFAFGVHGTLWGIVGSSLRQRLTPPEMLGRVSSTILFIAACGNGVGALLGGVIAARFGLTAPYWAGFFVVAITLSASTWRVFNRAAVARAYAEPTGSAAADGGARG